jgi:hypothetical protein
MFGYDTLGKIIASSATGFYKLYQANQQDTAANRLKPTGYIPPAEEANQRMAEQQNNATTYAGQASDEARNRQVIANAVGNVQRNARSANDVLNSAANIEAGLGSNMANQIANRYQQFKQNALARLMQTNARVGQYQNNDFWNYLNYKRQLQGAAMQNRFGAVNDLSGAAALGVSSMGKSEEGDGKERVPSKNFAGSTDYNLPTESAEMYA